MDPPGWHPALFEASTDQKKKKKICFWWVFQQNIPIKGEDTFPIIGILKGKSQGAEITCLLLLLFLLINQASFKWQRPIKMPILTSSPQGEMADHVF